MSPASPLGTRLLRRLPQALASALAAALALQLIPWSSAARLYPSLSPLLSLGGALADRSAGLFTLLGLPVLALGLWRKRWFCFHACPAGYCAERIGRLNPRAAGRFGKWPRLGGWLALLIVGSAAAGYPLLLGLDPLSLFNGFFSAWNQPWQAAQLDLAVGFILVLLISLGRPHLWCLRLCPLGGLQDGLHTLARRMRRDPADAGALIPARRAFLGLAAGGFGAWALRKARVTQPAALIRPPGAVADPVFAGLCARCGACVKACPYRIIQPALGEDGVTGLLAPVVHYGNGYCYEGCQACTQVCPTRAIRPLTLKQKRNTVMGTAAVTKKRCLAWENGLYCMVCQEFCPYTAIRIVEHKGVNCPEVDPALCRGCGACQKECPALPEKAIVVQGRAR